YAQKKMYDQAIAELEKGQSLSNIKLEGGLGYLYAVSGRTGQARRQLAAMLERSRHTHVDAAENAGIYLGLGDTDKYFEWLEKAYQDRSEEILMLKIAPELAPFRSDPRYL